MHIWRAFVIKENFGYSCDARALMNLQRIESKNKKRNFKKNFVILIQGCYLPR